MKYFVEYVETVTTRGEVYALSKDDALERALNGEWLVVHQPMRTPRDRQVVMIEEVNP